MNVWQQYALISGAAFMLVVAVVMGLWLGGYVDEWAGTGYAVRLILAALGLVGGVMNLVRTFNKFGS